MPQSRARKSPWRVGLPLALALAAACGDDDGPDGRDASAMDMGSPDGGAPDGGTDDGLPASALRELPGPATEQATRAVPSLPALAGPESDTVVLDGARLSLRELTVALTDDATVDDVNGLLRELDAAIVSAVPEAGVLVLWLAGPSNLERVLAGHDRLSTSPAIAANGLGFVPEGQVLPPADGARGFWQWTGLACVPTFRCDFEAPEVANWGLVTTRLPQAWNLAAAGMRAGRSVVVAGIWQADLDPMNPAIAGAASLPSRPAIGAAEESARMTHLASLIVGRWGRDAPPSGVSPYATAISVESRAVTVGTGGYRPGARVFAPFGALQTEALSALVRATGPTVLLMPYGIASQITVDPVNVEGDLPRAFQEEMDRLGDLWQSAFQRMAGEWLMVCSAGNADTRVGSEARYGQALRYPARANSPCANVAARYRMAGRPVTDDRWRFIAVEATDRTGTTLAHWEPTADGRSRGSSAGGTVSAPGTCVGGALPGFSSVHGCPATADGSGLGSVNGTSVAAAYVAGVAAYLWSIDPRGITAASIEAALRGTAHPLRESVEIPPPDAIDTPSAPRIDAFAAAMFLDMSDSLQRALVDVDDGTEDGNQRTERSDMNMVLGDAPTTFTTDTGRRGDGDLDMSDFRAFRDAATVAALRDGSLTPADVSLDGRAEHQRHDGNEDGCVGGVRIGSSGAPCDLAPTSEEDVGSRFDFNGDGFFRPTAAPAISDFAGPFRGDLTGPFPGRELTDLEVLQEVWPPALEYAAAELRSLLPVAGGGSADLDLRVVGALDASIDSIEVSPPGSSGRPRVFTAMGQSATLTVPLSMRVRDLAPRGMEGGSFVMEICVDGPETALRHAEDRVLRVGASRRLRVTAENPHDPPRVLVGEQLQLRARPCGVRPDVRWSASAGTIDASGLYTAPTTPGTYTIDAVSVDDSMVRESIMVRVVPPIELQIEAPDGCLRGGGSVPIAVRLLRNGESYPDQVVQLSLEGSGSLSAPEVTTDAIGSGTVMFTAPTTGSGATSATATYVEPTSMTRFDANDTIAWDETGTCACRLAPCAGGCGVRPDGCGATIADCGDRFDGGFSLSAPGTCCGPMGCSPSGGAMNVLAVAGADNDTLSAPGILVEGVPQSCTGTLCGDASLGGLSCRSASGMLLSASWSPTTVHLSATLSGFGCTADGGR